MIIYVKIFGLDSLVCSYVKIVCVILLFYNMYLLFSNFKYDVDK